MPMYRVEVYSKHRQLVYVEATSCEDARSKIEDSDMDLDVFGPRFLEILHTGDVKKCDDTIKIGDVDED